MRLTLHAVLTGAVVATFLALPARPAASSPRHEAAGYAVLYSFQGGSDGEGPNSGLIVDASGALYGTTSGGGSNKAGTVYKLTPSAGSYTESILYTFTGSPDGAGPIGPLVLDPSGSLYGATSGGGSTSCACGTVFKLTPTANGYVETILHSFGGADGRIPDAGLFRDATGALWGTTYYGGKRYKGVVFKLTPSGSGYVESTVHFFSNACCEGGNPAASLLVDAAGSVFGTAETGGATGTGTAFELQPKKTGVKYTDLYDFSPPFYDGAYPTSPLIMDAQGSLYGTSDEAVFKLTRTRKTYTESLLYAFSDSSPQNGLESYSGLTADAAGDLYGVTYIGGTSNLGTVYMLTPSGSEYTESVLHSFQSGGDGSHPFCTLAGDGSGALYGTTTGGGAYGYGTVFTITP